MSKYFENNEEEEEEEETDRDNMMIDTCLGQVPSPRRFVTNTNLKRISNLSNNNINNNNVDEVINVDASADWDKVYSKRLSNAHRVSLTSRQGTYDA